MTYGLVNDTGSQTEIAVMKSKKISDGNIGTVSQIPALFSRLNCGDTIWIATVADFPSVSRFAVFADAVLKFGIVLRIVSEPYLEVGNGKHWRASIQNHIDRLVALESANAGRLFSFLELNQAGKDYVARCITDITIGILAKTYASDGILHR